MLAEIIWDERRALPAVLFVATRHITRGEELVIDYGNEYWTVVWKHLVRAQFEFWARIQPPCEALEQTLREKLGPDGLPDKPQPQT